MTERTIVKQTEQDTYFFNASFNEMYANNKHQKEGYSVNMVQIQNEKWKSSTLDDLAYSVYTCAKI